MPNKLPLRDEEPTLGLIRELRDADVLDEALMQRALAAKRPEHTRRIDAAIAEPNWDDLQILTAQLATKPLFESVEVDTTLTLGRATRPTRQTLASPLLLQLAPLDSSQIAELRVDSLGLQVFADARSGGPNDVRALCVHSGALAQHRQQLMAAELPFGVRVDVADIERDVASAIAAGADFVMLDAGAAAIRALAQTRNCLEGIGAPAGFATIVAGQVALPNDFIKALALGADAIVVARSTIDSIFKLALTPGVTSLELVDNFVVNALQLMKIMARACGHDRVSQFAIADLSTWLREVAAISGVACSGQTHTQ